MQHQERKPKDKRKYLRCPVKLYAQLEISLTSKYVGKIMLGSDNIIAMVETCNISTGGMMLRMVGSPMDAKKSLTKANVMSVIDKPIEVVFCDEGITAWGNVIRADAKTLEIAIVIKRVSDIQQWKTLCSHNEYT